MLGSLSTASDSLRRPQSLCLWPLAPEWGRETHGEAQGKREMETETETERGPKGDLEAGRETDMDRDRERPRVSMTQRK